MPDSDALFSALEIEVTEQARPGFRLEALELFNWGTFDGRVETLTLDGRNALVTGDIGSGKSTLVDAVTTLLLPANRINYNKAAGAETRERSLRTYVLGHYRSERIESTGGSRPVGLRDHRNYSVVLGRFRNDGFDQWVTLAQVFWMPGGAEQQPRRYFVTHDGPLSISPDFTDFGGDPADLKRRLRGQGANVSDHFPEYGNRLRRMLGIRSEQALELFHQTISLKSVGNLTEFVRAHMLEPADTSARISSLVSHFDDLSRAHEAVRKAREQLAQLEPITAACDEFDELAAAVGAHTAAREAVRLWVAERRAELLERSAHALAAKLDAASDDAQRAGSEVERLQESLDGLRQARDGVAGGRLSIIETELRAESRSRDERRDRAGAHATLLERLGLPRASDRTAFEDVCRQVATRHEQVQARREAEAGQQADLRIELRDTEKESRELRAEIASLQGRASNIDSHSLALRDALASALGLDGSALPFVGELIQVRDEHAEWSGAAERVLRGFALSVIVPMDRYAEVAAWVDARHLRGRFVYFPVGASVARRSTPLPDEPVLAEVLEVRPGPYAAWVTDELAKRADHVRLDGPKDLAQHRRAVTRHGQVKADRRHEKDDRYAVDDRTRWVLGWSNAHKVDALLARASQVGVLLESARTRLEEAVTAAARTQAEDHVVSQLMAYTQFSELDWASSVARIADLEAERAQIERGSSELAELQARLDETAAALGRAADTHREATKGVGALEHELAGVESERAETTAWLSGVAEADRERHRAAYPVLQERAGTPGTPAECLRVERELAEELTRDIEVAQRRQGGVRERAAKLIGAFRQAWPSDTVELGADIEAAHEFRELAARIATDDLPRFEAEFKKQLNTNTINDIAGFQAWLDQSAQTIRTRIRTIDESLGAIDYNPGTRISLLTEPTTNQEVRTFREELRACTDDALSGDDQYSEERFGRVKAIIERFRGRVGFTDADRRWTALVTDVRNWFVFAASERDRDTGQDREHYTDSDGKSGGQKEKLAYTILAASLAYQFGLEWGVPTSRDFRFTVIDEAFGRGSDASTRYALELFRKLGLQLLVVTPLQKVHVIEPYVSAVGFVENRTGQRSRLQTLTIEDYHEQRARLSARPEHAAAGPGDRAAVRP